MKTNMTPSRVAGRLLAVAAVTFSACMALAKPGVVQLPAGSVNGLAAAIASAGPGGTVIVKSGLHTESSTVTVGFGVNLIGEPGAILESSTSPDPDFPITIEAALHLKNAPHAKVEGIWFRPSAGTIGSCAVVIEDSPHARVVHNRVSDYQFGVLVHHADHARVSGNTIEVSDAWALDPSDPGFLAESDGIIVINGRHVRVTDNAISGGFDGIWMCDEKGYCADNTVTDNFIGLLLCRVAEGTFVISGADAFASQPGTAWLVHRNEAHDNDWGIQATDGSHDNVLLNNAATANHVYDCELTGDTLRYGFFVPGCFDNLVVQGGHTSLAVKDCGANNTVRGNVTLVDTTADPCF
ncbi:MAG: right-handed parallel beta-helix repeat-containing protein [Verrucomicrobia bacterium]|nr:right-handed parallel beta-helix repeat-containing protein [Verrucomicrobiota bacterium]